jgi:hypothetical protein
MMRLYNPFLFLLARSTPDDLHKLIEFLKAEIEMLRNRVPQERIFLTPDERARLLKLGMELGPGIRHVITIVHYWYLPSLDSQGGRKGWQIWQRASQDCHDYP